MAEENASFRIHRLGNRFGLVERLGEREGALEVRLRGSALPAEVQEAAKLSCDRSDVRRGSRRLQRRQRRLEALHRSRRMTVDEVDIGQARSDARGGDRVIELLIRGVSTVEQLARLIELVREEGHLA